MAAQAHFMAARNPSRQDRLRHDGGGSTDCRQRLPLTCGLPREVDILPGEAELLWSLLRDEITILFGNG